MSERAESVNHTPRPTIRKENLHVRAPARLPPPLRSVVSPSFKVADLDGVQQLNLFCGAAGPGGGGGGEQTAADFSAAYSPSVAVGAVVRVKIAR